MFGFIGRVDDNLFAFFQFPAFFDHQTRKRRVFIEWNALDQPRAET